MKKCVFQVAVCESGFDKIYCRLTEYGSCDQDCIECVVLEDGEEEDMCFEEKTL